MAADGMVVCIDGVEQTITPLIAEDGCRVRNGNGFAYRAQDGTLLTIFVDPTPDTSVPVPSTPPAADTVEPILSQSPGCFASDETQAVGTAAQPLAQSPEEEESRENDLWSGAKTRFFITKYMELKELLRKKGGFRASLISTEFNCTVTPTQTQNKWKSLERAYKRSKTNNSSSGHSLITCDYEEELAAVLEKEHHITPTVLLVPGEVIENNREGTVAETEPCQEAGPSHHPSQDAPARKRKSATSVEALVEEYKAAKQERELRFEKKMALLERLVGAVEACAANK
ncbi:uncharacterized protein LOC125943279 [Dermacentor silvarum]|uniref:uncharacterized protein LOC125943279 n=1 Tax=Dermacentor silvarum TaxID=543639 RepID=UPI00210075C1|nr:uncharacterized protein LOC125943279 [Dermacentor silvarum]